MNRRTLLALPVLGLSSLLLTACTGSSGSNSPTHPKRIAYGSGSQQFGELHLPKGGATPKGVVVVIHGGFWLDQYDYTLGTPLAESLAEHGWAAWNIEYRRIGDGGGDPATMNDVAAAIDKIADLDLPDSARRIVVALGHSAGGQLAGFAASRGRHPEWSPAKVKLTHVIAQAGVMDLQSAYTEGLGGGAVQAFLGHRPTSADNDVDPIRQVPLTQPVWCVHGNMDNNVPISQSISYVDAAQAAGADATLVRVSGDHFALITTSSSAWKRILDIFASIA